jgi:outer membrane lipoprotein-sorting protein
MNFSELYILTGMILVVMMFPSLSGCVTSQNNNLTAAELGSRFIDHAGRFQDYQSEYFSTSEGQIRFDWKRPSEYRMEYISSQNIQPGTLYIMNRTTAVSYYAKENTYQIRPEIRDLLQHDYQAIVKQVVRDGKFTTIGTHHESGRVLYGIEAVTGSDKYTAYPTSRIQAWIDPESGLVWNITTFYPWDTANNVIRYDRIEVNTGIPESRFSFSPPPSSRPQCGYDDANFLDWEKIDPATINPAFLPGCMNCTEALLTRPVGGFNGDRFLISLFKYSGSVRAYDPDPSRSINFTFYARQMDPGTVRYSVFRVSGLYATQPLPLPPNFTVTIEPDIFMAEPGSTYISKVTVHLQPDSKPYGIWLYLHTDVKGEPDAIADDWVRVAVEDGSEMSGMGLYHFYQGTGGYCQDLLVIPKGGSGHALFLIRTGELDTGMVSVNLTAYPCDSDHGPLGPDELPSWPSGIHATVDPDRFTGRSFADYFANLSFEVDPSVRPGDYCFSAQLRKPMGGFDFSPITVRVIQQGE